MVFTKEELEIIYGSIYIIRNIVNNKVYIGQTTQLVEERFKQHMKPCAEKFNYKIYKAIAKYGKDKFYYDIIEEKIPINKLNEKEIFYIELFDSFKNGYNSTKGGDGRLLNKIDDVEEIVHKLEKGHRVEDICNEYNCCRETISRSLKRIGIKNAKSIQGKVDRGFKKINREKVKELYMQGLTHTEIANKLNINQRSVSRIVKELGINKRAMVDYNNVCLDELLSDLKSGMKKKDINKKYGFNQHSIKVILRKNNIII